MIVRNLDFNKFKALVHYICDKAKDPSCLGSIKLNKVLWYSEAVFFLKTGDSITGESFVKRQFGPVPRHVLIAIKALIDDGKVARGKVDHFGFMKTEFISTLDPDISMFGADEIALVDEAFEHVCLNHTARSISEETHGVIWNIAEMGEEIPLQTVFASSVGEIDETDVEWATQRLAIAA